MSQIFCVRTETSIGLAVVRRDENEKLTLLETYPNNGDSLDNFGEDLKALIEKHDVAEIWVSRLVEGEGRAEDLKEFSGIPIGVEVNEMSRIVKPVEGRIARAAQLKAGLIDESLFYGQSEKLSERIEKLSERPDIHSYLCAVVLAEPEYVEDSDDMDIGNCDRQNYSPIPIRSPLANLINQL